MLSELRNSWIIEYILATKLALHFSRIEQIAPPNWETNWHFGEYILMIRCWFHWSVKPKLKWSINVSIVKLTNNSDIYNLNFLNSKNLLKIQRRRKNYSHNYRKQNSIPAENVSMSYLNFHWKLKLSFQWFIHDTLGTVINSFLYQTQKFRTSVSLLQK